LELIFEQAHWRIGKVLGTGVAQRQSACVS
jgi:hypothetical protein